MTEQLSRWQVLKLGPLSTMVAACTPAAPGAAPGSAPAA